jgi:hypothetical protein
MPIPTSAGLRPTDRVRKIAQLVYHAPSPTAVRSLPHAIERNGPAVGQMRADHTLDMLDIETSR